MKQYMMLAAAAVVALVACARLDTLDRPGVKAGAAIGFSSYTPRPLSKVNDTYVDDNALASGKAFAVYAWQTDYGAFLTADPGIPQFMNPAVVTWNNDTGSGSGNAYEPKRYWPSGDEPANLSFAAYYPHGGAGITPPTFGSGDDPFVPSGVGTYAFTAQATPAAMVDFCVADVVNDQVYGATNKYATTSSNSHKGTVNFSFRHMLTKVQFKFRKSSGLDDQTVVELVDAELSGIKNSGTLSATYAQNTSPAVNAPGATTTEWGGQTGSATYEITVNQADPETGSAIVLTESVTAVHNRDIFLMVPQDMAASTQAITVTWKVKSYNSAANATANNGTGLLSETTNTKTLYFSSDLVMDTYDHDNDPETPPIPYSKNWVKNNAITYTITIGPTPIYFTGTVTNWLGEQNGYFSAQ